MSWESNYHLEKLEQATNRRWVPVPREETLLAATRHEARTRGQLSTVRRVVRLASLVSWIAPVMLIAGIVLGAWSGAVGVNAGGAAAALIVPNLLLSTAAIVGRVYLTVKVLPRLEDAQDVASRALDERLADTIGGAA